MKSCLLTTSSNHQISSSSKHQGLMDSYKVVIAACFQACPGILESGESNGISLTEKRRFRTSRNDFKRRFLTYYEIIKFDALVKSLKRRLCERSEAISQFVSAIIEIAASRRASQ